MRALLGRSVIPVISERLINSLSLKLILISSPVEVGDNRCYFLFFKYCELVTRMLKFGPLSKSSWIDAQMSRRFVQPVR